jgi:hypothetical protein
VEKYILFAIVLLFLIITAVAFSEITPNSNFSSYKISPSISSSSIPMFNPGSETQSIYSTNAYLTATYYGTFGEAWLTEQGFFYNITSLNPPDHYDGIYAFTDSPAGPYDNNLNIVAGMSQNLAIPPANTSATCTFYAHWDIEADFDGMELEVSTDGGFTWDNLRATDTTETGTGSIGQPDPTHYYFEGQKGDFGYFLLETADLTPYIGTNYLRIRFHFRTDGSSPTPYDGFVLDDFTIEGNVSGTLLSLNFDSGNWENYWQYASPWGVTQANPYITNGLSFGQTLAGTNSGSVYVAYGGYYNDYNDWYPSSGWNIDPYYCKFENTQEPPEGPHLEVYEFFHGLDYSFDDFVIVDTYYHNIGTTTANSLYFGPQMDLQIAHSESEQIFGTTDDVARYDDNQHLAYLYDPYQENYVCYGLALLSQEPLSVNFSEVTTEAIFINQSLLFALLSNGDHDWQDRPSWLPGETEGLANWCVTMGVGPINLPPNGVYRVCYAILGGNSVDAPSDSHSLKNNTTRAFSAYSQIQDMTPFVNSIQPCSLGQMKAMFAH